MFNGICKAVGELAIKILDNFRVSISVQSGEHTFAVRQRTPIRDDIDNFYPLDNADSPLSKEDVVCCPGRQSSPIFF